MSLRPAAAGHSKINFMKQLRLSYLILAFALVAGTALRVYGITGKKGIDMDEGISYLAATGHEGEYAQVVSERIPPYSSWGPASEWKRLIRTEKALCFRQIGFDLAHHDVHPPLYFWILHIWLLAFGEKLWIGPLLNVFCYVFSALALYSLASYSFKNLMEAALVTFIWSLSPAVIRVDFIVRSYSLLVLFTILFALQIVRCSDPERKAKLWDFMFLSLVTAGGILTHYHFSLLVAGGILYLVIRLVKRNRRRHSAALTSIGIGVLMLFIFHPHFYLSFQTQQEQAGSFKEPGFLFRLNKVFSSFMNFFIGNRTLQLIVLGVSLALVITILITRIGIKRGSGRAPVRMDRAGFFVVYFFFWMAGSTVALYLARITSLQQMGTRYLSMVYTFLAFLPVFFFRLPRKFKSAAVICFCFFILFSSGAMLIRFHQREADIAKSSLLSQKYEEIVMDNVSRLFLPRLLWYIPDDKKVFAADQDFLLEHAGQWLPQLHPPALYISRSYKIEKKRQREILALIGQSFQPVYVPGGIAGIGDSFVIWQKIKAQSTLTF